MDYGECGDSNKKQETFFLFCKPFVFDKGDRIQNAPCCVLEQTIGGWLGGNPAASQMPGKDEKSLYGQDPGGAPSKANCKRRGESSKAVGAEKSLCGK